MIMPETLDGSERETDDPRLNALIRFYRAFNRRDLALMESCWAIDAEVTMSNPLGGIKRGWPEIAAVYARIFSGKTEVRVEFHDFILRGSEEMFVAVGRERGSVRTPAGTLDLRIRTSRIFEKMNGTWKQTHHHGSIDDADMLRAYHTCLAAAQS